MSLTDELRSFNRFYTAEIGLLNKRLPGGDLSLPDEAGTLATLRRYRDAMATLIERHDGRIVHTWLLIAFLRASSANLRRKRESCTKIEE